MPLPSPFFALPFFLMSSIARCVPCCLNLAASALSKSAFAFFFAAFSLPFSTGGAPAMATLAAAAGRECRTKAFGAETCLHSFEPIAMDTGKRNAFCIRRVSCFADSRAVNQSTPSFINLATSRRIRRS